MKKNLIINIVLGIFVIINLSTTYFFINKKQVYIENRDDNSYFHGNSIGNYAAGLDEIKYDYNQNEKNLISKLFFNCNFFNYSHLCFDDFITLKAWNARYSFFDSHAFCTFTIKGYYPNGYEYEIHELMKEYQLCMDNRKVQDYIYKSDIKIDSKNIKEDVNYFQIDATIFFPSNLEDYDDKVKCQYYNSSDLDIGKELYKYDFQIYQKNIDNKIDKINKIIKINRIFLISEITILLFFIPKYIILCHKSKKF